MLRCNIIHFLMSVFPLKIWQGLLIHSHVDKCETCRGKLASLDEVKTSLYQESDVENFREIWPDVKAVIIDKKAEKKAFFPTWLKWASATAGFVTLILAGVLFYSILIRNGGIAEKNRGEYFRINSISVGDEPATPFLYQPQDSDMIIVWAEKSS
jgi:predicted anti-sigma-YlaC factor YlaD